MSRPNNSYHYHCHCLINYNNRIIKLLVIARIGCVHDCQFSALLISQVTISSPRKKWRHSLIKSDLITNALSKALSSLHRNTLSHLQMKLHCIR